MAYISTGVVTADGAVMRAPVTYCVSRNNPAGCTPKPESAESLARRKAVKEYLATEPGITASKKAAEEALARKQSFLTSEEGQRRLAEADAKKQAKEDAASDALLTTDTPQAKPTSTGTTKYLLIGAAALAAGWFFFLRKK